MRILAIETSCDETSIAIIEKVEVSGGELCISLPLAAAPKYKILAHETISQINKHIEFGGVFPTLAKREHEKNLPIILESCLHKADLAPALSTGQAGVQPVDYIAVTNGPGLPPALWVGVTFAKDLSAKWGNIPLYPINHMEGHIVAALSQIVRPTPALLVGEGGVQWLVKINTPEYPVLSLLISGGHTEFILSREPQVYEKIGETQDDAVGECFDKVARMLGLPYPGGPEIGKLAEVGRKENIKYDFKFPRPMLHSKDLNFSFSGLKTSILYFIRDLKMRLTPSPSPQERVAVHNEIELSDEIKIQIATEFEYVVRDVLFEKSKKAIEETGAKSFVVGGGVISSPYLRDELQKLESDTGCKVYLSDKNMATDNALMIALVAATQIENKKSPTSDFSAVGSKNYNWE